MQQQQQQQTSTTQCDLTPLDICLAKCTNPLLDLSEELIKELCVVANSLTNGPFTTLKYLAYKLQSPQQIEAIHSLKVLEMVVKHGGYKIANEIGKFRFLNEIIKVVSPKYLAHQTSAPVRNRIIELIFQWSMDFKELPKIFEAYQMLKVQKIVLEDPIHVLKNYRPPTPPKPRPKDEIFDDEQTVQALRTLIESGRTEHFNEANKMIKNLADKAETRMQFKANFQSEIESAKNCSQLLSEMLAQCNANVKIDPDSKRILYPGATREDVELMKQLLDTCQSSRFRLYKYSNQIHDNDEPEMRQFLETYDMLMATIDNCKCYFNMVDGPVGGLLKSKSIGTSTDTIMAPDYPDEERLLDLTTSTTTNTPTPKGPQSDLSEHFNGLNINVDDNDDPDDDPDDDDPDDDRILDPRHQELFADLNELNEMFNNVQDKPDGSENDYRHKMMMMMMKSRPQSTGNQSSPSPSPSLSLSLSTESNLRTLLANVNISYDEIMPSRQMLPPLLVYNQNGLIINLHQTENDPHPQVKVFLLTFTNYNRTPISEVNFLAAVPKRMRVKLQCQTGTRLPGLGEGQTFPRQFISQAMLIAFDQEDGGGGGSRISSTEPPLPLATASLPSPSAAAASETPPCTTTKTIQFKLKYKLKYILEDQLNEHCSQFVWHWNQDQQHHQHQNHNPNQNDNNNDNNNNVH